MSENTKTAFITGATGGIGRATVQTLLANGWRVLAADLPASDLSSLGNAVVPIALDLSDPQTIQEASEYAHAHLDNGLQALINIAGINVPGALETMYTEMLERHMQINVFGHLQLIRELLPRLRASATPPRIVNVSSLMGRVAFPLLGAYSLSKHALEALSDVLRFELAPSGIYVSVIEFGAIDTPMTHGMTQQLRASFDAMTDEQKARYQSLYEAIERVLSTQSGQATPAQTIADGILHALTAKTPKPRYALGADVRGLLAMRALSPDEVGDAILRRVLGLPSFEDPTG